MKLLNLSKKIILLIFLSVASTFLLAEEDIDIWNKKNFDKKEKTSKENNSLIKDQNSNIDPNKRPSNDQGIEISENLKNTQKSFSVSGIYDPEENNFNLDMWSNSEGTRIKDTIDRIDKINLSSFADEMFTSTILTNSYLPFNNMTEEEFLKQKLDWLIKNKKDVLIEVFLNKNQEFSNKTKVIKYLVDQNIAKANIKDACSKMNFIGKDIKDKYLEKFKIICLIKSNKKNEAQLMLDILREQKLSDKFFDTKVNFLLGISENPKTKILDDNLLNFYLSSITDANFEYIPTRKTDQFIWKYLSASNLLKVKDINKEQLKELEEAANNNSLDKSQIFEIYKNIPNSIRDLLRAEDIYKTLEPIEARALIYQKFLLSDSYENKIKYLFLLNELFKKNNLSNIYKEHLSNQLKLIDAENIPEKYQKLVSNNITLEADKKLGKIRYSDTKYESSRILRFYTEKNFSAKNIEKELNNVHKKIKKNKKYKLSLKDLALFESLESDGIKIPKDIYYKKIAEKNAPPVELLNLMKNNEIGLLSLRIVELIGEDKIVDFDDQSIYFINHLLNKAELKKFRNKLLITSLPQRD